LYRLSYWDSIYSVLGLLYRLFFQ